MIIRCSCGGDICYKTKHLGFICKHLHFHEQRLQGLMFLAVFNAYVFHSHFQVDVLCGYKETESLVEELMKMKIPDYKPSSNHVHLSDTGELVLQKVNS